MIQLDVENKMKITDRKELNYDRFTFRGDYVPGWRKLRSGVITSFVDTMERTEIGECDGRDKGLLRKTTT